MANEITPAGRVLEGEILLPGEPNRSGQECTGDLGPEAYTFGVFERYVYERLLELMELLGDNRFHSGFKNGIFWMQQDYPDKECSCGYDQKEIEWGRTHPHMPTCELLQGTGEDEEDDELDDIIDLNQLLWPTCDCPVAEELARWQAENHHDPDCEKARPRFRCGDIEFDWYKHIGRRMRVNRLVTKRELKAMFERCFASLQSS